MACSTNNGPFERFIAIYGTVFDSIKTDVDRILCNYDVLNVEAPLLPYIDALIGWPTNFDLGENQRRQETLNAVNLYKIKGRNLCTENFAESISNWDATVHEGWRFVMFSNDPRTTVPTPSTTDVHLIGTPDDPLFYVNASTGSWHALHGLLLELEPVGTVTDELLAVTITKLNRMLPGLLASWADIYYLIHPPITLESISIPSEYWDGPIEDLDLESVSAPTEYSTAVGSGYVLMVSNEPTRTSNTHTVRIHHENLGYTGPTPPPAYSAGP